MTGPTTASGIRKLVACAAGIVALVAGAVYLLRTDAPEASPATAPDPITAAATPGPSGAAAEAPATRSGAAEPDHQPGVLPLDNPSLARFQEMLSQVTTQFMAIVPDVPYPVRTARAAQETLLNLGYDPDRTVRYWLSPEFEADLARESQPGRAVDARRTTDNLLSILLGDQGGTEEFEHIIADYSPEAQALARARRTR